MIFSSVTTEPESAAENGNTATANGEQPAKKKRGRPRKNPLPEETTPTQQQLPMTIHVSSAPAAVVQQEQASYVPVCNTTDPYETTYNEGINMIRSTIMQMDMLAGDMKMEFDTIRNAKQLKGRYHYISSLGESIGSMLSSKLTAIKELNAITTKCHELEMKRYQQNKELQKAEDDDHYIANMYNAYINTPVNTGTIPPFLQQTAQNTIGNPAAMMGGIQVNPNGDIVDSGYNNYIQQITPEQNRMIMEHNPNIKTVVVYDRNTGGASFDVIDVTTGMSVPNYPRPNPELIAETTIDVINGRATNSNLGESWDVVMTNDILSKF